MSWKGHWTSDGLAASVCVFVSVLRVYFVLEALKRSRGRGLSDDGDRRRCCLLYCRRCLVCF